MPRSLKSAKKVANKSVGQRPVIQFRVKQDVYDDIVKEAKRLKLTVSEEAARRLDCYADYLEAMGDVRKWLSEHRKALENDTKAHLRMKGWTPIVGVEGTYWAEPGAKLTGNIHGAVLHPDIESAIERAVERAMKRAAP